MSNNKDLENLISNLNDDSLVNNALKIEELLNSGEALNDELSEILFVISTELLEKIKTNPNNYNIGNDKITSINNIIRKLELSFMDLE